MLSVFAFIPKRQFLNGTISIRIQITSNQNRGIYEGAFIQNYWSKRSIDLINYSFLANTRVKKSILPNIMLFKTTSVC